MTADHARAGSPIAADAPVLCIGLDIAWFGGSAGNPQSQYDCLAVVYLDPGTGSTSPARSAFRRIPLVGRDPDARLLLAAITALLQEYAPTTRILLAGDAPLQALPRPHLEPRCAKTVKGKVVRRACEDYLSAHRQRLDRDAGGCQGWQPNIQPGAPLAPRIIHLLAGLAQQGFTVWTPADQCHDRLMLESFPAEAIWAMRRQGQYPAPLTVQDVKAYKRQQRNLLTAAQVQALVHVTLDSFADATGNAPRWRALVDAALAWMLADDTWKTPDGYYRGGKLLDDVVDSLICLATALSYHAGLVHVWQDPAQPEDGHIIGPGRMEDMQAVPANTITVSTNLCR